MRRPFAGVLRAILACAGIFWVPGAFAQSFTATPNTLVFQTEVGAPSPPTQTFDIVTDPPGQTFSALVEVGLISNDWLGLIPTNGVTPATVTVIVDSSRFVTPGSLTADIIVTLTDSGLAPQRVKVTVNIAEPSSPPTISAAPSTFGFGASAGGVLPQPQQLILRNVGGDIMDYQIAVAFPAGQAAGWLDVSPPNGSISFNSMAHQISITDIDLPAGSFEATILITGTGRRSGPATNSPLAVPVTLTLGSAATLTANPASLTFFASEGGAFPDIQQFTIQNAGGGALTYTIAPDQPWLFVRPTEGDATNGPVQHEVIPDIRGIPQGTFTANLAVTSENAVNSPFQIPVLLVIGPPSSLFAVPSSVDFLATSGLALREKRLISVVNTPLAPGRWAARVLEPEATWLKLSPAQGRIPGHLVVEVDTAGLGAGPLRATIEIRGQEGGAAPFPLTEGGSAPEQTVATVEIPVRMTVINRPPLLDTGPRAILFEAIDSSPTVIDQILEIENDGGPLLNWSATAQTEDGAPWLSVAPDIGVAPSTTRVTANTTGLAAGVFHGTITVTAGDQQSRVPVALVVSPAEGVLEFSQSGAFFRTVEGQAAPETGVRIFNRGTEGASWTAQAGGFTGADAWLAVSPRSGTAAPGAVSEITLTPNTADLAPGLYGATVELRSVSRHSPRLLTAMLRVAPATNPSPRVLSPGGVSFASRAGAVPAPRTVRVWRNRPGEQTFQTAANPLDGEGWLSATPQRGQTDETGRTAIEVQVDPSALAPGTYRGLVSLTFGDGLVHSAWVTLVVSAAPPGACSPTAVSLAPVSPQVSFVGEARRALAVETELIDSCGRPVEDAGVLAMFNDGDAALPLNSVGQGRYAATWVPRNASTQANVTLVARAGSFRDNVTIVGGVSGGSTPFLPPGAVVNGASFAAGGAIAGGAIISAFGSGFTAGGSATASAVPLPTTLSDATLFVGGRPAPLFFLNLGQINAQAPTELNPMTVTQVFVLAGGEYSVPQDVAVAVARPGVFSTPAAMGPNRAIAQNQDFSLNAPNNPTAPGEAVIVYLSGIGATDPPVPTGEAAPSAEPLARATLAASATIGGVEARILFLGMAPGFVGLAQANLLVPAGAPLGADVPLVVTVGSQPSNTTVIAVGAAP